MPDQRKRAVLNVLNAANRRRYLAKDAMPTTTDRILIDDQVALDERHSAALREQFLSDAPGPSDQADAVATAR